MDPFICFTAHFALREHLVRWVKRHDAGNFRAFESVEICYTHPDNLRGWDTEVVPLVHLTRYARDLFFPALK